jgi:multidrug resistance protein, MATE family
MAPLAQAASPSGDRPKVVRTELAALMKLAWPVVLSRLGIMAMGLTDAIVVGRYSAVELGYHAMAWAPASVVVTMVVGLLSGVQVMTSRAMGEGRPERTGAVLRRGLSYGLWIGGLSGLVLFLAGPALMHGLGLTPDLADGATRPLRIFSLSLPSYAISVAASFWLEGQARPGPAAAVMWAANGVNLILDLLLVPGTFGLPALGAMGGAWATTGARTFLAIGALTYIARMPGAAAMGVFDKPSRDHLAEAEQRRIGFGAGASGLFETAAFAGMNVVAGWISALAVAAWAITLNMVSTIFMVPLGLSTAAAVRVGGAYGARDTPGVWRAALVAFAVTTLFGILVSLVIWPLARPIAQAYTGDVGTLALTIPVLRLACLFLIPDALQVVCAQTLRARGDVWVPTVTHLASYVLVMVPLAWWLAVPLGLGLNGVIWAVIIASFLSAGLLLARFWMLSRQRL